MQLAKGIDWERKCKAFFLLWIEDKIVFNYET